MKELEVELEQLRLLVVAVVGAGGLCQWFWWGDSG